MTLIKRSLAAVALLVACLWLRGDSTAVLVVTQTFPDARAGNSIRNIGGRALYWRINYYPDASTLSCTILVDSSLNGNTWVLAGVITSQTCTSPGTFTTSTAAVYNYVRMRVSGISASKQITATLVGFEQTP